MSSSGPLIDCEVTAFVRGSNPVWYFVDLVGKQFDDTFYMFVLENQIPYIPATVYHDPSGTVPWVNPIRFLANGTLPIDIYFANNTIYRLEFRQGPTQADPLIYLVENYNPSQAVDNPSSASSGNAENQISNSQFSAVNFDAPTTYTNLTTSIEVAPGWFLDLSGLGSVVVEHKALSNAQSSPTNAPWALRLTIGGPYANVPVLRQRFQQNGQNWAGKTVTTSFTAQISGAAQIMSARLVASNGATLAVLATATLSNSFQQFEGFGTLGASTNANVPPDAYIDYKLMLPSSGDIYITSVQVAVSDAAANIPYQQDTIDRQLDHLAHYYKPQLQYKPIPSYLIGWDFAKNPAQILGDTVPSGAGYGANKSFYVWDQTIVFQSVDNGVGVTRNANGGGLQLVASLAGQYAIIQYLEMSQVRDLLLGDMSVYINALTNNMAGYFANVSLWVNNTDANLPNVATGTNNSIVATLSALGKPATQNGTWTEIPRSNFGDTKFLISAPPSDFYFNGWNLNGASISDDAKWFAIVIGIEPMTATDSITFQSVGLCAGKMATRPAAKTQGETVLDCQRYFYSTFPAATKPITNLGVDTGGLQWTLTVTGRATHAVFEYPTTMRVTPNLTIYNPAAANNAIRNISTGLDCVGSAAGTNSKTKTAELLAASFGAGAAAGDQLQAHLTSDARLGIVN